jgi:DNA-binding winged helix-turn-helix (wHTH) protein
MHEPFVIDNRYLINPEKNTITDRSNGEESRLEQRLLDVLNLLADSAGELVSRDKLATTVWNDYGGADEGLTQAISFLRKVLNDRDKKIIETIPKKGYILNAVVLPYSAVSADSLVAAANTKNNKGKYVIGLLAIITVAVIIYLFTSSPAPRKGSDIAPQDTTSASNSRGADVVPDTTTIKNPDIIPDSLRDRK